MVYPVAQPLARRLWRSYLRTALVPLLLVEAVLVSVHLATSNYVAERTAVAMRGLAEDAQMRQAVGESDRLARQLGRISGSVGLLVARAESALAANHESQQAALARLQLRPDGVLMANRDDSGPAVWRGNRTPLTSADRQRILRGATLDRQFQRLVEGDLQTVSFFLITANNAIRSWPWFDAGRQYAPALDLTAFSYYRRVQQADASPSESVWTEPYLDPAGNGWMVSCSAPVRLGNELCGVVGANVTLKGIIDEVLGRSRPWQGYAMLVAADGCLIAIPPAAERDFGIRELALHRYVTSVTQEFAKPEELHLERLAPLAARTDEGWLYLSALLDLYARKVVGWAMDQTMETSLVIRALDLALTNRRPAQGLIHHSDRGSQYASSDYQQKLSQSGLTISMSLRGNCHDNACAESFWARLKVELVYRQRFATRDEARQAIFEYLETFHNRTRIHSAIGNVAPQAYENAYYARIHAA